jgi:hypothetical protein
MMKDFFDVLSECISCITTKQWVGVIGLSFVLALLCRFICVNYTKLWNKRFHAKALHHFICGIAVVLTVLFTTWFYAFGNLSGIVYRVVDEWEEQLVEDDEWSDETFERAYLAVEKVAPNAFSGLARPGEDGCFIPLHTEKMIQVCVTAYVDAACESFGTNHPYLDMLIHAKSGVSEETVTQDINDYFENEGNSYPAERGITLAAAHIREELVRQIPETVTKTRWILFLLFVTVQLIPFGWIGYCAYKDLSISRRNRYNCM